MAATFIVKTFVFIESNTTGTGRLCLQKALLRGFDVLFVTSRPQLYPFLQEEMVVPLVADTADPQRIADALAPYAGIAGIFSTSEYYIETAATVATRLGLPAADPEAIRTCRDKGRLHRRLRDAGVGVADTEIVSERTQLRDLAHGATYPRVLKPAFGSGSVGVRLVRTPAEMLAHGERMLDARGNERGIALARQVLVQSFVDGPEFSVEVVGLGAEHGHAVLGVTGKHLGPLPHFVEAGHDFPAPIAAAQRDAIVAETLRALDAVGHRFGPAHVECRVSGGKVVVIEINPRLAGGMIPQAIEWATGVDVLGAMIDLHAGTPPDLGPRRRGHAAIRFVLPARSGELRALSFEPDERFAGVRTRFMPLKQLGQRIEPAGDFRDRLALVIASAADPDALAHALEDVDRCVTVAIGDAGAAGEGAGAGRPRRTLDAAARAILRQPRHDAG
ncbi:ATP-grasp domain-containing protein, partial [Burkholderia pseudomallei]|uniref:ATP-grasp domain-containing protein n=1 Tax=Burkholderia pseudomallei TaxID=28450 RepID=UPI0015C3EE64